MPSTVPESESTAPRPQAVSFRIQAVAGYLKPVPVCVDFTYGHGLVLQEMVAGLGRRPHGVAHQSNRITPEKVSQTG